MEVIFTGTPRSSCVSTPYVALTPEKFPIDGYPDLTRKLGADLVKLKRRKEADDPIRNLLLDGNQSDVLRNFAFDKTIESMTKLFCLTSLNKPLRCSSAHSQDFEIAGSEYTALPDLLEQLRDVRHSVLP
jgi:hypothetical protein